MSDSLVEIAAKLPDDRPVGPLAARRMLAAIEARRVEAGLSYTELARLASVPQASYRRWRAGHLPRQPAALRKLARALRQREDQARATSNLLQVLAIRGLEDLARAVDPQGGGSRARKIAIYLAHVELGLPQKHLARLYGCSGNYINMVVQRIEAGRDDGTPLDAALLQISRRLDQGAGAFMRGAA